MRSMRLAVGLGLVGVLVSAVGTATARAEDSTRYVATTGTDNPTCDKEHPCLHVQHAVDVASPGDAVKIASGTYVEQVLVGKNLTLSGAGVDRTVIKGPDVKAPDQYGKTYILEVTAGATLGVTELTVSGPSGPGGALDCAPNPLSLDMGVAAINKSTLDVWAAAVRNIYDIDLLGNENSGCQRGDAISVGKPGGVDPSMAVPANANIADVLVSIYQKNGVAVRTAGSNLEMVFNRVENRPSSVIASNGVEVVDGPVAGISWNTVTGNECNLPVICGPDPFNQTEASGILSFAADARTVVADNWVSTNDLGIYTDDGIRVAGNHDSGNRDVGIYVDTDATRLHATDNTTNSDGSYGIAIGPAFAGPTGKPNPGGNFFSENSAFGNQKDDLFQSADAGPNANSDNHCGTAFPSRAYWDCEGHDNHSGDASSGGEQGSTHPDAGTVRHHPVSNDT